MKRKREALFLLPAFHHIFAKCLVLEEILNGLVGNHLLVERVGARLRVLHHLDNLGVGTTFGSTRLQGSDCFLCHSFK